MGGAQRRFYSGVSSPSSGTAYIDDYDIRTSLPQVRKQTGLCPQYNILFNSLTVMEHLEFFCKLKVGEGKLVRELKGFGATYRLIIDSSKESKGRKLVYFLEFA